MSDNQAPIKAAVYDNDGDPNNVKFRVGGRIFKLNFADAHKFGLALAAKAEEKLGIARMKLSVLHRDETEE